jgi:hypothetical protein
VLILYFTALDQSEILLFQLFFDLILLSNGYLSALLPSSFFCGLQANSQVDRLDLQLDP